MYQAILPSAHTPLAGVSTPIFTAAPPRYLPGCFPLAFLEGRYTSSSSAATSLCLDPMTWDPSAPSNRAASSSSTSSRSHWRYSIILLFLSSSSATLCFLASSLALASASLLAFWATHSAQCNFAASSSQACLPRWPPFSQHVSWRCCNPPDILSSTAEILLFNLVFYDRVTPVSVSTLKPRASPILSVCI